MKAWAGVSIKSAIACQGLPTWQKPGGGMFAPSQPKKKATLTAASIMKASHDLVELSRT
jgi:hypothetical protein